MPQFRRRFYYGGNSYGALRISATDAEPPADQFREHLARIRHAPARNRGARPVSIHPHLWTRFHEQLGVFLDGVRELAGDPAADSVASALDGVLVRSRDGRTE